MDEPHAQHRSNDSATPRVPIVILAGSDRASGSVPRGGEEFHFVRGYKGADIRIGGRPIVALLVERLRAAAIFAPIYLAGPLRIYRDLVDAAQCEIIDTDASIGENVARAEHAVRARHGDDARVAFIACDVLPAAAEIVEVGGELLAAGEADGPPPALAVSLCALAPQDGAQERAREGTQEAALSARLGSSRWKPRYHVRADAGTEPIPFLPGHLAVAWPAKLRTGLFYRLLRLAYRERNRDYDHRKRTIIPRVALSLLLRDLMNVLRLKPPLLTWTVLRHGVGAMMKWRRGTLDIAGLERGLEGVCVHRDHVRAARGSGTVRVVVTPHLSFAKDLDTAEEIEELREAGAPREE